MPRGTRVYPNTSSVTRSYTRQGDSYNVNINDPLAAALFLEQVRQQRIESANAYM